LPLKTLREFLEDGYRDDMEITIKDASNASVEIKNLEETVLGIKTYENNN